MSELGSNPEASQRKTVNFKHPDAYKLSDPQAIARMQREIAYGDYYAEGLEKILNGEDPQKILLEWAQNATTTDDERTTVRARAEALEEELLTDEKTESGNETKFLRDIEDAMKTPNPTGILLLDLDGFKRINDTLGHDAGDEAIVWFNKVIRSNLRLSEKDDPSRTQDETYHLHGDEQAVLVHNASDEILQLVGDRIRTALENAEFEYQGSKEKLTTSVGAAMLDKTEGILGNIKKADRALYDAKNKGKNQVVINKPIPPQT